MRRLGILFVFILGGPAAADVVLLKDGTRVSGKVVEKGGHYEVATEAGLRTYLKDEVDRVVKDPKEFLGDADGLFEAAKKDYEAALALPELQQQGRFKEAVAKVTQAREAYAAALDLFPENDALGKKLMLIMQLMRLCRDRLGSEMARPMPGRGPVVNAPGVLPLEEAFGVLLDPARRADATRRASARESFRLQRSSHPEIYELATAAMLFLARSDAEWQLQGASLQTLQQYFAQPWMRDPFKLTAAMHQNAAAYVLDQMNTLRKADAKAPTDALSLFGIGHLGHAPAGPENDRVARLLGLVVQNGIPGTPEGHVVKDLNGWIGSGDFDLAVLAFIKEHRAVDTAAVRFVWSYALLRLVQAKKRGFERPVSAYQTLRAPEAAVREHVDALVKSIKAVANCTPCGGEGRLRCTNCHGRKEIRDDCLKCKGKGKVPDPGFSGGGAGGFGDRYLIPCYPCRGRGFMKLLKCEKCKDGFNDCKQCDKPVPPPALEDICSGQACGLCDGRGWVFRKILWACKSCLGLGQKLVPNADRSKVLP
jgi:hypothetical protein